MFSLCSCDVETEILYMISARDLLEDLLIEVAHCHLKAKNSAVSCLDKCVQPLEAVVDEESCKTPTTSARDITHTKPDIPDRYKPTQLYLRHSCFRLPFQH